MACGGDRFHENICQVGGGGGDRQQITSVCFCDSLEVQ